MFIVWIVLSVLILFIIVETATSKWLNSETERISIKTKWLYKTIQGKFLKKKAT